MINDLAFYAVATANRVIYEVRPIGDYLLVRPAAYGQERNLSRLSMLDFEKAFNLFLGKFLIPSQLTEDDAMDLI